MPARLDLSTSAIDLTRTLCDIESVSGDERPLADAIEEALGALDHLEVIRDGDAVVARTTLGRNRRVVIAGHIDTVPINANVPTKTFVDSEALAADGTAGTEVLWGRGTVDMKGGCAVQLKLAHDLVDPTVDVTWVWYDHEEVSDALNGLGRLARTRPELLAADFAILGEPSNAQIEGGCNGNLRAEIRAFGRRSHSARGWIGENAIHKLAPALQRLAEYRAETVTVDGLEYREGLNAVGIHGGIAGNVIPDEAMLHVNYRFAPSRSGDEAIAHIRSVFDGYDVRIVDLAEGARPGLDASLAQEFVAAVGGPAPKPKYGWTDVARFSALGVPAVNYGPGDPSLAHHDHEQVPTWQISAVEQGLRRWLTD
ncbi:succinyl-diaminopimelate desuccinylase [Curtobacterium ammoniigenes]|uniref:succinyl-diaminopimelate desuccinylase n=1 Tax=Curtobacterium ammoniigenes TaxID=395387 RepID=UPI00082C2408|nr:succinyl-diaminopimelate desuccinylase [Curtobacterium ammoniigenes]